MKQLLLSILIYVLPTVLVLTGAVSLAVMGKALAVGAVALAIFMFVGGTIYDLYYSTKGIVQEVLFVIKLKKD